MMGRALLFKDPLLQIADARDGCLVVTKVENFPILVCDCGSVAAS